MRIRPRRNRYSEVIRGLVRETRVDLDQLISPLFITEDDTLKNPIKSLPGQFQLGRKELLTEIEESLRLGIKSFVLFPAVSEHKKDSVASYSYAEENFYLHAAREIKEKGAYIAKRLDAIVEKYGDGNFYVKGRGMFQGINCVNTEIASKITRAAYKRGLIIETSGTEDQIIKLLCPLTIKQENLAKGIDIIEKSVEEVCATHGDIPKSPDYFDDVTVEQKEKNPKSIIS
jgi:delta-aminolevulinic acid dehydratase/porphobilinogen synthase